MAINLPNDIYTGGAVRLSSQPEVNLYAQVLAKKQAQEQAKNAAIDEYIRGLSSKITSTGVRAGDMPEFNDRVNRWREFVTQNRENMNDMPTQMQANALYQQALDVPTWSKAIEERKKPAVEIISDPVKSGKLKKDPTTNSPILFSQIHSHDQSRHIKDPNTGEWTPNPDFREVDFTSNIFRNDFDPMKFKKEISEGLTAKEVPDLTKEIKQNGLIFYKTAGRFGTTQITEISKNAGEKVRSNPDANEYFDEKLIHITKPEFDELNAYYNKYGGTGRMDNAEKLAMAEAAKWAEGHTSSEGMISKADYEKRLADTRTNIYLNQAKNNVIPNMENEFNRIKNFKPLETWSGIKTEPYSGSAIVSPNDIPYKTKAILKSAGIDIMGDYKYFKAHVVDGNIKSLTPVGSKDDPNKEWETITADDMQDAQVKYFTAQQDKERNSIEAPQSRQTNKPAGKSISTATLKSLIGGKGYEGYTLEELIEYYKSNGYKVK